MTGDDYLTSGGVKPVTYVPPPKPFQMPDPQEQDPKKALYLEGYGRQFGEKMYIFFCFWIFLVGTKKI